MCLMGHVGLRVALSAAWWLLASLPKLVETVVVAGPVSYLAVVAQRDFPVLGASFLVGAFMGWALFTPLVSLDFSAVCTTYLSTLAWTGGNLLVCFLSGLRVLNLIDLREKPAWLCSLGEAGYLGFAAGLALSFGEVAIDGKTEEWCRASEAWPAEAVYLPVFFLACLSGLVSLTVVHTGYTQQQ